MKRKSTHTRWASSGLRLGAQYAASKIGSAWKNYQKRKGKRVATNQPSSSSKRQKLNNPKKSYKTYKKITKHASGNEISTAIFKTNLKPSKATKQIKIADNVSTYRQIDAVFVQSTIGIQAAANLGTTLAYAGTWGVTLFRQAAQSFQDLVGTANAKFDNVYTSSNYNLQKFFLGSCTTKLRLLNEQASVVEVDIYCIISKQTTPGGHGVDPFTAMNTGLSEINGESTANTYNTIDSKPTESKLFNTYWKIATVKRVTLQPGKQLNFTWRFNANRVVDVQYFQDNDAVRGLTHGMLCLARGSMVGNVLGPGVDTKVDFAPVKLVGTVEKTFQSRMCNFYPRNYKFSNNCSHDAVAYTMQEESGLVVEVEAGAVPTAAGYAIA